MNQIIVQVAKVEAVIGAGVVYLSQEPGGEIEALKCLVKDMEVWKTFLPGQRYAVALELLPPVEDESNPDSASLPNSGSKNLATAPSPAPEK